MEEADINRRLTELMVDAVSDQFGLSRREAAVAILEDLRRDGSASFGPGTPGDLLREMAEQ